MINGKNGDLIILERKVLRALPGHKWTVNKNTPVGEPADFYWLKPYGGRKLVHAVAEIYNDELIMFTHDKDLIESIKNEFSPP